MTFDRTAAIAQLAKHGVDLDAPMGLGSSIAIRNADDAHLAKRLRLVLDDAEDTARETLRAETISIATAVGLMRKAGLQGGQRTLDAAIASGALEVVFVNGVPRATPAGLARYIATREAAVRR